MPNRRPVTNKRPGWVLRGLARAPHVGNRVPNKRPGCHRAPHVGNRVPNKRPGCHRRRDEQPSMQCMTTQKITIRETLSTSAAWRSSHLAQDLGKKKRKHIRRQYESGRKRRQLRQGGEVVIDRCHGTHSLGLGLASTKSRTWLWLWLWGHIGGGSGKVT